MTDRPPIDPMLVPGRVFNRGIVVYPDLVLARPSAPLLDIAGKEERKAIIHFADRLRAAQQVHGALGVAACQLGIPARMFLFMDGEEAHVVLNPEVTRSEGEQLSHEGCLSLPGGRLQVRRPTYVRLVGKTLEAKVFEFETDNPLTCAAICHEMDHLDGQLIIDHVSRQAKKRVLRDVEKRRARARPRQAA